MFNKTKERVAPGIKRSSRGQSVLGPTLTFKGGELSSDEDLIIEGTVEGRIAHQSHQLTIGKSGRVKADVHARIIIVEGTIEGNLRGDEAVYIGRTARVVGNVTSPRVSMEDGATFDGSLKTSQASPTAVPDEQARLATLTGGIGFRARLEHGPDNVD
jgi:cytoskeletal protein CcmA (bactofilin family)